MILRAASAEEATRLGEIGIAAWRASAFGIDDAGRTNPQQLAREFIAFCAAKPETVLVAVEDGQLLGWGAREMFDEIISDLWVAPNAQGRGVGAALLAGLEAVIALEGFGHAELETYAGNAGAVRFYTREGYQAIWRGLKFSATLNYELDKIRFRKTLQEAA